MSPARKMAAFGCGRVTTGQPRTVLTLAFNRPTYSSAYHDAYAYHDAAVDGPTHLSRLVGLPDRGAPRALAP